MTPLHSYLILSSLLFSIGLAGALTRRNGILVLIGIELMLNAANLNFIAFWRYSPHPEALTGIMFVVDLTNSKPGASGRIWFRNVFMSGP